MRMKGVSVKKIIEKMNLKVLNPEVDIRNRKVTTAEVNRPALQLNGFFEHFEQSRVEIIGMVEYANLQKKTEQERKELYDAFLSFDIPCVIFCRGFEPDDMFLEAANRNGIPVLGTERATSGFMAELINILTEELAPCITIHGVLVDVYRSGP